MKQMCLFFVFILLINVLYCSEATSELSKFHNLAHHKSHFEQPASALGPSLPDAVSYFEGWVHFYNYNNGTTIHRPRKFFENKEYFAQRLHISEIKKADKHGPLIIPNKSSFYLVVNPNSVLLFSSREDTIRSQIDSLDIQYINPIPEDNVKKGGIHDLGSFSIGNCFEIKSKIPNDFNPGSTTKTQATTWVFCLDKPRDKAKLMKTLIKLKIKIQRTQGDFKTEDAMNAESNAKSLAEIMRKASSPKERDEAKVGSPRDGYWVLIQDWTSCTLKCGGGESYQQWRCIPPKSGGKPCAGKSIKIKKCNTQPCPNASTVLNMIKVTSPEVKKPIVKVAPFSTRLQRYSKCVIKENDAFLSTVDPKSNAESKLPIRIVMNSKTLSLYKDDSYQNILHSYELQNTNFVALSSSFCCFELRDSLQANKICGYEKNCGDTTNNQWVKQWAKDFTLFKVECHTGLSETLLTPDDEKKLADDLRKKLGQARMDIVGNKQKKLKQQMMVAQNNALKSMVMKTQNVGFAAIQKELQLEKLVTNEEKQREDFEVSNILKKIKQEKEKENCLKKTIKERDIDAEIMNERRSTQNEVTDIKKEITKQIQLKRNKMKKLIESMRNKAKLRKMALEGELNSLRQRMAQEMLKANKNGDINKCRKGKTDFDARENYCNANYIDDFVRNSDCKTDDNFCYMCCESEFGNAFITNRDNCYNMCDLKEPKKSTTTSPAGNGPWLWTAKSSK